MRSPVQSWVPLLENQAVTTKSSCFFCFSKASFHPISNRFHMVYVSRYVSKIIMLTTSVEAICFNYRPKKDNTYPIMLRLTKSGKRKYVSLGVSVKEENWDFSKNIPRPNCPDRDIILAIYTKSHTGGMLPLRRIGIALPPSYITMLCKTLVII